MKMGATLVMTKTPIGKSFPLDLTEAEREVLHKLIKAGKRNIAKRANVLLALDRGQSSTAVAEQYQLHPVAIRRIKQQFLAQRLDALQARKRTGRRPLKRTIVEAFLEKQELRGMLSAPDKGMLRVIDIRNALEKELQVSIGINTVRNVLKKRYSLTKNRPAPGNNPKAGSTIYLVTTL